MLSHGGQMQSARISAIEALVRPTDRFALTMPLYHIGARNLWLMHALFGCPIILHRAFRPAEFTASIRDHGATATLLAPTMLNDLIDAGVDGPSLPTLQKIIYWRRRWSNCRAARLRLRPDLLAGLRMTESADPLHAARPSACRRRAPAIVRRLRSAGQPMVGCDVRTAPRRLALPDR